jgi:nucleoside-diphosphate-sugar epimerase
LTGGFEHFRFAPQQVVVVDNLSNGRLSNIHTLLQRSNFEAFYKNDLLDEEFLDRLFTEYEFDCILHLAACINVQESIDNPRRVYDSDVTGTMNLLERIRPKNTPIVFVSTCMVYDMAGAEAGIDESHPVLCASPYAGAKLAAEKMVESYHHAYGLPTVTLRPFNTYGPYQKTNGEGGVVAVFAQRDLAGETLDIYGDGTQTRDLMYVVDCAEFIIRAAFADKYNGELFNAGTGQDVTVNDLAWAICGDRERIRHVPHIHPQSEIPKLLCNAEKAMKTFHWRPRVTLEEGIQRTREYLKKESLKNKGDARFVRGNGLDSGSFAGV